MACQLHGDGHYPLFYGVADKIVLSKVRGAAWRGVAWPSHDVWRSTTLRTIVNILCLAHRVHRAGQGRADGPHAQFYSTRQSIAYYYSTIPSTRVLARHAETSSTALQGARVGLPFKPAYGSMLSLRFYGR